MFGQAVGDPRHQMPKFRLQLLDLIKARQDVVDVVVGHLAALVMYIYAPQLHPEC